MKIFDEDAPPVRKPTIWTAAAIAERFNDVACDEYGHTPATWAAFVHSDVVGQADAIYQHVEVLIEMLDGWLKSFGGSRDPGADAITAAGLPVPDVVLKHRTSIARVTDHVRGLRWALDVYADMVKDDCPDPREWDAEGLFVPPPAERGKAA